MIRNLLRKIQADVDGAALVYTLLVTAVLMIAAVAIISLTGIDSKLVLAQENKKIVQYAAESAVEVIRQQLISEGKPALTTTESYTNPISLPLGDINCQYKYRVSPGPAENQYILNVLTKVTFESGKTAEKELQLVIEYTPGQSGSTAPVIDTGQQQGENPPTQNQPQPKKVDTTVYDYALATGGPLDLTLAGTSIAGNVFANSSVRLKGDQVAGKVKAYGPIVVLDPPMSPSNVAPDQTLPLTMPVINWDYLSQHSETMKANNEPIELAAIINKIVFVSGNVTLRMAIPANTLIAASGDIRIQGDSTLTMSDVGLIAGNNIYIDGPIQDPNDDSQDTGPQISGLLIAGNEVATSGSSIISGTVVAGSSFLPGKDRHAIFQDRDAVESVFKFIESKGRTRKDIIANYDVLNVSYTVPPANESDKDTGEDNSNPVVNPNPDTTSGTLPEITIVRWKELN